MARYDKYDPVSGGFRAPLAAAIAAEDAGTPIGVGLNTSGRVDVTSADSGILGVLVVDSAKSAGDIVDVMTAGEIVEVEGLSAGTVYYAASANGSLNTTNTNTRVGHTVEATRLVVRVQG